MVVVVSRNGTRLPIPAGSLLEARLAEITQEWPNAARWPFRSRWLHDAETILYGAYPQSSSADRRLTARGLAPFALKDGPNVP